MSLPGRPPRRVLFVFAWLVVGGEETEVRLLARRVDPRRYRIGVIACLRKANMPEQTHEQLAALGVEVDRAPYELNFEETIAYLMEKIPRYDLVVACQAVPDVEPAYARLIAAGLRPPPLIEHGGLVEEALRGSKRFTARYVGVCHSIWDAAAAQMPDRPHHAVEIPSMVDLDEFRPADRTSAREELGISGLELAVGWVGRLDRKKRVEDFLHAAALLSKRRNDARFVVIGGPDAFMPEYAVELQELAVRLDLAGKVTWTGDRPDVPRLLQALDVFVWLSRGEGMPHVIAEAGAAALPVVATCDNGVAQQIADGESGLFVPHEDPQAVAAAIERLLDDVALRRRLGAALQAKVRREYGAEAVARRWEELFDELLAERERPGRRSLALAGQRKGPP